MTTRTQKLAKNFPAWTRVRWDPSSMGQRWFAPFAKAVDTQVQEQVKRREAHSLLQRAIGTGLVHKILLDDQDLTEVTINTNGTRTWAEHSSVVGTWDGQDYTLEMAENLEDLVHSVPDVLYLKESKEITNRLVYSRIDGTETLIDDYQEPHVLVVHVQDSTNYYRRQPRRNPRASGYHRIILTGRDINYQAVTEALDIPDDGVWQTTNIFTQLQDVDVTGLDGDVRIYLYDAQDYVHDPYKIVSTDETEGPLHLRLRDNDDLDQSYLQYFTSVIKSGALYRDGANGFIAPISEDDRVFDNEETQWEQHLLDDEGTPIIPRDLAVNPQTGRLYILDEDSSVHIYEHGLAPFGPPSLQSELTLAEYLRIQPIKSWCLLGETLRLFTSFSQMRYPLLSVTLKRISPTGVVRYLQADRTWGAGTYSFDQSSKADGSAADSWSDIGFDATLDELGQWEFYSVVDTRFDQTVSYTGVMVDGLQALRSFETDIADPIAIYFDHGCNLVLGEALEFHVLGERINKYLPDYQNHELLLRDEFDSVEVQV